jgi:hypothetical protein
MPVLQGLLDYGERREGRLRFNMEAFQETRLYEQNARLGSCGWV